MKAVAKPVLNSEVQSIIEAAADSDALHSGQACIWTLDDDETDRGFDDQDLNDMVANSGPKGRVAKVYNEEPMVPWRLGHEDDGEFEEAFREAAVLPRTDHPALAHSDSPLWRGTSETDPTRKADGRHLWADFSKMPEPVRKLTDSLYPWRSAEVTRDYRGLGATVLGVGMVGVRPAKKGLGPMILNSDNGKRIEVHRCAGIKAPIKFAEETTMANEAEPTPLGMLILQKAQAKAAANEDQTTDTVMAEIVEATGMDSTSFQASLMGQGEPFTDQQLMAIANVLAIDVAELQAAGGGPKPTDTPDEEPEVENMSDKTKKTTKPAVKDDKPVVLTPEQFAELTSAKSERDSLKEQFAEVRKGLKTEREAREVSEQKAAKIEVEQWAQTELFADGRVTGDNQKLVMHALNTSHPQQVEQFADGDTMHDVLKRTLKAITTPKVAPGHRPVSKDAKSGGDADKPARVVEEFAAKVKANPRTKVKIENFAELANCTSDEVERVVAMAKKDRRIGAKRTLAG